MAYLFIALLLLAPCALRVRVRRGKSRGVGVWL